MIATIIACALVTLVISYVGIRTGWEAVNRENSPPVTATDRRIVEVRGKHQIELELSDGRQYRTDVGWVWYCFPSDERAPYDQERWLQEESDRLLNIERWAHADEKERPE